MAYLGTCIDPTVAQRGRGGEVGGGRGLESALSYIVALWYTAGEGEGQGTETETGTGDRDRHAGAAGYSPLLYTESVSHRGKNHVTHKGKNHVTLKGKNIDTKVVRTQWELPYSHTYSILLILIY